MLGHLKSLLHAFGLELWANLQEKIADPSSPRLLRNSQDGALDEFWDEFFTVSDRADKMAQEHHASFYIAEIDHFDC